jgi:Fic family protein
MKRCLITEWLAWFAGIALEAQQRTLALIEFLIMKTKLLDQVSNALNERQLKALLRIFQEGPQGFESGLSARNYTTITGASTSTATRDLADLVEKGALARIGDHKYARYFPSIPIRQTKRIIVNERGDVV